MKNILIILIVFYSISEVKSQPYNSIFGNNSTTWNTKQTQLFGDYTDSLFYVSDTTINSQLFKKFYLFSLGQISPSYTGFLKEDTITGKAWYFSSVDTTQRLIMDLSLQLADSFMVNNSYYLVDSIYYVSGSKHIRLNYIFQFFPTSQSISEKFLMIEGVGTNLGVKYQDMGLFGGAPYLLCQYKDLNFNYGNANPSYANTCMVITAQTEVTEQSVNFEIFPNPTNGLVFIKSGNLNNEIRSVTFYNSIGQKVYQNFNFTKDFKTPINIQNFDRGICTLIIETSIDKKHFKIIKN
jgi:hypothetical protein